MNRAGAIFASAVGQAGMLLCALGVIWGVIWLHLGAEYRHTVNDAKVRSAALTETLDENISRSVAILDAALLESRALWLRDKANFRIGPWMLEHAGLMKVAVQISIADARGIIVTASGDNGPPPVSIADRPHFRVQAAATEDRLYISTPVTGRTSGRLSIQFTRRIVNPDGGFAGVVIASFDPLVIAEFQSGALPNGGFTMLIGDDGIIRAAQPNTARIGAVFAKPEITRRMKAAGDGPLPGDTAMDNAAETAAERGSRMGTEMDDLGIFSYRAVPGTPLFVAAGYTDNTVFALYRREWRITVLAGAALSLAVLVVGIIMIQQRLRLTRFQRALMLTMDNISQGILMIDRRRRMPVVNRRVAELLGLPAELARPGGDFDALVAWQRRHGEVPSDAPENRHLANMVKAGGIDPAVPFYERTRANGTVLDVRTTVLPDGAAVRTFTDVTERKQIEHEMADARDAARAGMRARTEFLAVMSHEIRTPMNGIIGAAGLLRETPLTAEQLDYLRIIGESSEQLSLLIHNILDFTRLDAGTLELEDAVFDPRALIEETLSARNGQARAKGLTLVARVGDDIPRDIGGDPSRLRQVLENLIDNGIKFTETGGITIEVRAIAADPSTVTLNFAIIDTGVGIDPESRQRLSVPFTQADSSLSRRFEGAGLGLAICRHLVALMGGTLAVDSTPGKGSTVSFSIRSRRASAARPATRSDVGGPLPAPRLRVLLAEDNPTNRHVATRMLTRMGHAVDAVDDGARAIGAAAEADYDVILMDMMMPEVDGLAATRAIRAGAPPRRDTVIIGLTANALPSDRAACEAAGMNDFVTKPVTLERLRAALARAAASRGAGVDAAASAANTSEQPPTAAHRSPTDEIVSNPRTPDLSEPDPPAASPVAAVLDAGFLRQLADEIGPDGVAEMIGIFVEDAPAHLAAIQLGAANGAIQTVRREAHALAGSASNVGLACLTEASRALQHACERAGGIDAAAVAAVADALRAATPLAVEWAKAHEGLTAL